MKPGDSCAEFGFHVSPRFRTAVALLHGLAALTVVAAAFPGWSVGAPGWLLAALPLLAISGWVNWRSGRSSIRLRCDGDDWFLLDPSSSCSNAPAAEPVPLHWLPSTRIGPRLTLLHAKSSEGLHAQSAARGGKSAGRRYFWPVASDSLPADEFRRLRVRVGLNRHAR